MARPEEDSAREAAIENIPGTAPPLSSILETNRTVGSVAICTVGELFGGVERHVLGMLEGLRSRSIDAILVVFHDRELAAQARALGVEPVVLSSANRSLLSTTAKFAAILRTRRVSIVHAHGYKAVVFCALTRLRHPFPLVRTVHGLPEKNASKPLQTLKGGVYHWLEESAVSLAGAATCCVTADLLRHHFRLTKSPTLIPNGIPSMEWQALACPPELLPDRFNITAVGRLEPVKALHLAIDAIALPEVPRAVHLQIVGTGPCLADLQTRAKEAGVADRVHFLGFRRDAHNFIAHCDALIMPSLHEGLPYTLLEAMALATPVIASRVGGLAEILENDVTGLLVPTQDSKAIAQAINRLHSDVSLRTRLGNAAQTAQRTRFSLDAMTDSYIHIYRSQMSPSAPR